MRSFQIGDAETIGAMVSDGRITTDTLAERYLNPGSEINALGGNAPLGRLTSVEEVIQCRADRLKMSVTASLQKQPKPASGVAQAGRQRQQRVGVSASGVAHERRQRQGRQTAEIVLILLVASSVGAFHCASALESPLQFAPVRLSVPQEFWKHPSQYPIKTQATPDAGRFLPATAPVKPLRGRGTRTAASNGSRPGRAMARLILVAASHRPSK
jgi:hypothetical protein